MKATYELTDGHEVLATRAMTPDEAQAANDIAHRATDGAVYWSREGGTDQLESAPDREDTYREDVVHGESVWGF
jgi:hypothetical protein